ncbi:MAG TPA: F0F1 ATP synthase subunit A [Prolixibacteraceae bacterium]|nr:F0F1 ATP synthase subunit A [Prolixibacteraceae bacterium]
MTGIIKSILSIIFAVFLLTGTSKASEKAEKNEEDNTSKVFDAGKFVMEHVSDSYEWHIATFGETQVSVPLPVILYSSQKGWNIFLSSGFHHGQEAYKGFKIEEEGKNEGKIVELNDAGEVIGLPIDLSITKTVGGIFVSVIILLLIFLNVAKSARKSVNKAPTGMQNLFEPIILFVRDDVAKPAIGEKTFEKFMPFLLTIFFFILVSNLTGLIPIFPFGANVTGNIAVTMVLALFTFVITTFSSNKHYWKEIYNPDVPWWLKYPIPLMPIVELTGVITKPFVLMIRLFANMLAGHLIITVFVSLIFIFAQLMGVEAGLGVSVISVSFSVFMVLLDVLVAFIQAYVFTLLSALYFGMASPEHH